MRRYLSLALLVLCAFHARADNLRFAFDFETARTVSHAIATGSALPPNFCASTDAHAMIRKMQLKNCDALLQRFQNLQAAATIIDVEFAKPGYGKYAPVADIASTLLRQYVPPTFNAQLKVHFIFGGWSNGYAFDDVPDDVYIDLLHFSNASTQELAETVAHELFHAVQFHVMRPEKLPAAAGVAATTGPVWLNHWLVHLEQEGTAELFTHAIADRPATPYSADRKRGMKQNADRLGNITTMFETVGWRMLLAPPPNEDAYDRIYELMFTTNFDQTAYDLGELMASAIADKDGKQAIFELLKQPPKEFLLRYQAIAAADPYLPVFSNDFVAAVKTLQ